MTILGIDPGSYQSGWLLLNTAPAAPLAWGVAPNHDVLGIIERSVKGLNFSNEIAIEIMPDYGSGKHNGAELRDSMIWAGKFERQWEISAGSGAHRINRDIVRKHLCPGKGAVKDGDIRQALMSRWGGEARATSGVRCGTCKGRGRVGLGKKRGPCPAGCKEGWLVPKGPLAGISSHVWAALAVAVTLAERELGLEVRS